MKIEGRVYDEGKIMKGVIMCSSKKRTYSRMGAAFALAEAQDRHNDYRPIRYYCCPECHKFHLTSKPLRKKAGFVTA